MAQERRNMSSSSEPTPPCPRCGAAVPDDAPGGQCPKCLLGAVAAPTEVSSPSAAGPAGPYLREWPTLDEVRAAFPELEVAAEIGRGGMAAVFRARQPHLDRMVALKVLAPWLAAEPGFSDRFSREGRALARLNHPNIVIIHNFGQSAGFFYLLMEYVDGVNLRQALSSGRFTPEQALTLVPKVCDALQYAHGEGVLHRDIKPDNILLDGKGRVKIADFGIAKLAGEPDTLLPLTRSGMHLGTPAYMAPEQVEKPGDVDHRADIYSLGVVFYEMLTGELPLGRFAAPSEKNVLDSRIDEIVMRTLEKERERRYQSAEEVKTCVQDLAKPIPAPPPAAPVKTGRGIRFGFAKPSAKASAGAAGSLLSLGAGLVITHPVLPAIMLDEVIPPGAASELVMPMLLTTPICIMFATAGIVLGFSGIRDIRQSGGHLRGSGRGAVAVLAWPAVLAAGAGIALLASRWPTFRLFVSGESPFFPGHLGQTPYMLTVLILSLATLLLCITAFFARRARLPAKRPRTIARVALVAVTLAALVPAVFFAFRMTAGRVPTPASLSVPRGDFLPNPSLARVTVTNAVQGVRATADPAAPECSLDVSLEAELTADRRLECEVKRRPAGQPETLAMVLNNATILTGNLDGPHATGHSGFRIDFPTGTTAAELLDAQEQINRHWRVQAHGVLLGLPEPLFRIKLADGSRFEAVLLLQEKDSYP